MKILLVGSGGREDALAWALSRSSGVRLRCAPGNAGIGRRAERVPIAPDDVPGLTNHVRAERYDLVVVGPEVPLVEGLADRLGALGVPVFGPSAAAARLEGSKAFAKRFMERHGIPTARFRVFQDAGEASRWLLSGEADYPLVVKADGLAAGKGVVLADDPATAVDAATGMLSGRAFGDAGRTVVVEERLTGREASYFVLSDGARAIDLATCQDHKRALDGDRGPNTGGMGAFSPSPFLDDALALEIRRSVVRPTLDGIAAERAPFRGVLFVGLMLTSEGPKVLEYNVRFGDPETQVLIPRLEGEWLPLLAGCAAGGLPPDPPRWRPGAAVCVVMASGGYPGPYEKGKPVSGVDEAERMEGVHVFHAGTETDGGGRLLTAGGRVLGVTALGDDLAAARLRAYDAVARIGWDGEQHRHDIGADALPA
jgi:phosphoribosylamine--glycine ligase